MTAPATWSCPSCGRDVVDVLGTPEGLETQIAWHCANHDTAAQARVLLVVRAPVATEDDRFALVDALTTAQHPHAHQPAGPNGLGVAIVVALAVAMALAGLCLALAAKPLDGANLIAAPALVIGAGLLLWRLLASARRAS